MTSAGEMNDDSMSRQEQEWTQYEALEGEYYEEGGEEDAAARKAAEKVTFVAILVNTDNCFLGPKRNFWDPSFCHRRFMTSSSTQHLEHVHPL